MPSGTKGKKLPKSKIKSLVEEYNSTEEHARAFASEMERQLTEILDQAKLSLAVPIQHRVKSWSSISEKLERKELTLDVIKDLNDLIGVRAILLFKRDVETACGLVERRFKVVSREDTTERLEESQFGYSSVHFIVEVPTEWLSLPTVQRFAGLRAELQVRSVAQHLWAASSHILQYKKEASVPKPVRRAIYRVSALLEMVDLEFESVLSERERYRKQLETAPEQGPLDVDSMVRVLKDVIPAEHGIESEGFEELLSDLHWMDVKTPLQLRQILESHKAEILAQDKERAKKAIEESDVTGLYKERAERGMFWSLSGLARAALAVQFGEIWARYRHAQWLWVSDLDLSQEIKAVLKNRNITTAIQLAAMTETELSSAPDISPEYIVAIKATLQKLGLKLSMSTVAARTALMETEMVRKKAADFVKSRSKG